MMSEHANFKQAEQRLENLHRLRMSKVMRDWEELEQKYQEMKKRSGGEIEAEEFKRGVTSRFQKTIKNLEEEGLAEKRQLLAVHQNRVLSHLNERKKEAMECFTSALAEQPEQNDNKIRKCVEKLMRILHKDRHHTLAHYRHLLKSNPPQSQLERDYTLQRLTQISSTARTALKMLERFPALNSKLRPLIEDYVLSLQGRDDPTASLLSATRESESALLGKYEEMMIVARGDVAMVTTTTTTEEVTPSSSSSVNEEEENQEEEDEEEKTDEEEKEKKNIIPAVVNNNNNNFIHDQIISVRREVFGSHSNNDKKKK